MSRPSSSAPPYAVKTVVIAPGQVEVFQGDFDFFSIISATAPNALEISINDQGFQPYVYGSTLFGLRAYQVSRIIIKNTDAAPNTVQMAQGGAGYQQANSSALPPGSATSANQALEIAALALLHTDLTTGVMDIEGALAAGSAIGTVKPVLMGGSDGTNVQRVKTDTAGNQVAVGAVAAGSAIGTTAPVMMGASDGTNVQRLRTDTSGRAVVVGFTAHDGAVSTDAPVMTAAEARSTERAAVASADVARLVSDLYGRLIVAPYTNPENLVSGRTAAMTGTADTAVVGAGGASVRNYITGIVVANSHATVGTEVVIKDGATELFRVYVKALESMSITFPNPLRGTANTAINAANVTTGSNTYVAGVGYRGA